MLGPSGLPNAPLSVELFVCLKKKKKKKKKKKTVVNVH